MEFSDKGSLIEIWICSEKPFLLAKVNVRNNTELDKVFKIKCFGNKSFYEIEEDVTIKVVF